MTYKDILTIREVNKLKNENLMLKVFNSITLSASIALIVILCQGCASTAKTITCSNQTISEKHTTTRFKDTSVYIQIPTLPSVSKEIDIAPYAPINLKNDSAFVENKWAYSVATIKNGKLRLSLISKPDSIEIKIDNAIRETNTTQNITQNKVLTKTQKSYSSLLERTLILIGLILLIILGITLTTKRGLNR